MVSKGSHHLKDFYLTLLFFYALWWVKEALTWKISTSHYCLQCIMVSKGSPHLNDFYLTLLSSMHYGEQRKPSLERFLPHMFFHALWWAKEALTWWFLPHIIVYNALWWVKEALTWWFLPHIIIFNALWWAKEALSWKIWTSLVLQCIMVSKGSPHWWVGKEIICCWARHILDIHCPSTRKNMNVATIL